MTRIISLANLAGLLIPFALPAQTPDTAAAAAPARMSGYVTTSFTHGTHASSRDLVGRLNGRRQDEFMLNVGNLTIERVAAADRVDAGFRLEAFFGQNAAVVKSVGLDLGADADIWQAYAVVGLPLGATGRSVQLKAGKMATLMGVEVGEDVLNPNLDVASQDIFLEPFTETGAEVGVKLGGSFDAQLRVSNGWDQVTDVNTGKTVMARVGVTPRPAALIALVAYAGPEQPGTNGPRRAGLDLVLSAKPTPTTTGWLQLDYGQEDSVGAGGGTARWYAAGIWLTQEVSPWATLALRGDYVDDRDGERTSGILGFPANAGQKLASATMTLNVRYWPHVLLRPEIRYDRSSLAVYGSHHDQVSAGLGLSYLF